MLLYLVQHAEARSKEEDPKRSLTQTGIEIIDRVARFIKKSSDIEVSEIRCSTKLRSRQTAERFKDKLGLNVVVKENQGIEPLDDVRPVAAELACSNENLMIVGHLPYLNNLASILVCGDENQGVFEFQNAGILCLERKGDRLAWAVRWMIVPALAI